MECNKDEAIKAKELAERKMQNNEFEGAHKIAIKAQRLYPELENINQVLAVCSVHCSAKTNMIGLDKDWYGILQVDRLADEVTIKKQYRKLALVLHPDKNKFPGAEAAFKLIGEANLVLSDKTKRYAYDSKRVSFRGGPPAKPPPHQVNPVAARSNFGLNGFNPQFTTQSNLQKAKTTSSAVDKAFWTSCPFCAVRYQYRREVVNRAVRCQNCAKPFIAYDIGSTNISSGLGSRLPGQQPHLQKEVTNQATAIPTVNPAGFPYFQPAGPQRGNTSQVFEDLKSKEKHGKGVGSGPSKVNEMPRGSRVKSRKRSRKQRASESSESFDTTSSGESEDFDMEEKRSNIAGGHGVAINRESVRRSSRRRHDVSYYENEVDDLHMNQANIVPDGKSQENLTPEGPPNGNPNADDEAGSIPNGPKKVEVIIDSESGSDVHIIEDTVDTYTYPDPEFHDFDKDREESCFSADQLWACYDTADGMPRFYAHIKKICSPKFSIQFNWLEIHPDDKIDNDWVMSELPVACGKFKRGKSATVRSVASFSHQVLWEKGKKGAYVIYPRKGEIWALFRRWDISWSYEPDKHRHFKYSIVEVLSDNVDDAGFKVGYLNKLDGYVSLFQGQADSSSSSSFVITKNEIYRFSHKIPFFRLSGSEREGVPAGAFELDPAGLPQNQNDIWCPLKRRNRNGQPNVKSPSNSSKPRCSTDVIDDDNDDDDDDDERPKVQKSPRPVNVTKKK
ncbi:unnamed protein product [Cuscuta campestris]|uniref:J domain-containing protein n=1 Tax=Cuscuta campestris TaxID=132261 RepID=A0A484N004_9ASTE|nr:unnamed protein product [Cuscuta campestris]